MNRVHFSSLTDHWSTPSSIYYELNKEFDFTDDPCPLYGVEDGLIRMWGKVTFVNPPYSEISKWMKKACEEFNCGQTVVMLVPSRTDTKWWHNYAMKATEIRFIKGRLKFGNAKNSAPFPSCVLIFRNDNNDGKKV